MKKNNKLNNLFIEWGPSLGYFTIYTSLKEYSSITGRDIDDGSYVNWFNIDNIRREIEDYSEKYDFKLDEKNLKNLLKSIEEKGFSYSDKNKLEIIKDVEQRNIDGIKIKIIN